MSSFCLDRRIEDVLGFIIKLHNRVPSILVRTLFTVVKVDLDSLSLGLVSVILTVKRGRPYRFRCLSPRFHPYLCSSSEKGSEPKLALQRHQLSKGGSLGAMRFVERMTWMKVLLSLFEREPNLLQRDEPFCLVISFFLKNREDPCPTFREE